MFIQKLNYYGVRGTANNWFSSYLEKKTQFVSINGYSSDLHYIHCGVPQGFTLGPLLFLVYIIVTRNNIVWKLAHGYYLCYCKTFSLVPNSTECTKMFLPKRATRYLYRLKSNNIIGRRKTTNTKKHFYPWLTSFNLKLSCT